MTWRYKAPRLHSHGIDIVLQEYSMFSTRKIKDIAPVSGAYFTNLFIASEWLRSKVA